jgi:hypothetical protein
MRETSTQRRRRQEDAPPLGEPALLALQRTAGNAAVTAWLQRDHTLPADPHTLGDVPAAADRDLQLDTDRMSFSRVASLFGRGNLKLRAGIDLTPHFSGKMAKDPKDEDKVEIGLRNIGASIFGLDDGGGRPKLLDAVHIREFDLDGVGGLDGRYRFTCVVRKGTAAAPQEVDLIIELVGAERPAFKLWKELDGKRRNELTSRFSRLGFVRAEPTLTETVDTWTDDQWGKVLQALEKIPEASLSGIGEVTWARGHGQKGPTGEAGYYQLSGPPPKRRLTLYDGAFRDDDSLTETIAHELGHSLSFKPTEGGGGTALALSTEFQTAANADSPHAITKYGDTNWHEKYAEAYGMFITEPDTLKALRPKTYDYFVKQQRP